jgi:hypothetical protein
MYKVGDEVIENSTGRKAKIVSKAEMAEMCYELKFPDSVYNALRFAREITPANTVCTGQERAGFAEPGLSQPSLFPAQGG